MKATFAGQYRKSGSGNLVFKYTISGTPEEIAAYEKAQGDNLRHDEKTKAPLMFATRPAAKRVNNVILTRSGRYIIDNSDMDQKAALAAAYGGNLGQALAQQFAAEVDINSSVADTVVENEPAGSLNDPK